MCIFFMLTDLITKISPPFLNLLFLISQKKEFYRNFEKMNKTEIFHSRKFDKCGIK